MSANEDDRKLFVGGLPQEAKEGDIREYFGQFGNVTGVNLKMDQMTGRSRGFCFVVFENEATLQNALAQEHVIKGKKVACKKAASKQGKVYVGKFSNPSISEEEIRGHFEQYGTVVEIQRPVDRSKNSEPKNFCFVTFEKEESADKLLKMKKLTVSGQEVEVKKVTIKADGMMGMGGMRGGGRGGMRGGRGGGWGGGYDNWGGYGGGWGGYDAGGWGYQGGYGGGWGGPAAGAGWGGGDAYGGGKMSGFRGGQRGGRGGRTAPY